MNRFTGIKTLGELYNVFTNEEVLDYKNLTVEELERVADVFEANIPDKISMPDRPLTEAGYELIWNVTIDTVEAFIDKATDSINNSNKEEITMNNNNNVNNEVAATEEEITMGEKAKMFAESSKDKLKEGFEFVVEHVDEVKEEVVKMANMPSDKLEEYLLDSGKDVLNNIINAVKRYSKDMKDNSDLFPSFKDKALKADNIIELIKDVLDEEELNGWGKFKAIVKAIALWLVKLLLKVGAFILKLAFTLIVGAVKIGATACVTTGKVLGIVNKDVVKPVVKTGKKAFKSAKERLAKNEDFDDVEEMLFEEDYSI